MRNAPAGKEVKKAAVDPEAPPAVITQGGEVLWRFPAGSMPQNSITYAVDGRQYVAVAVGWGHVLANFLPGYAPETKSIPRGSLLLVFALPETSVLSGGGRASPMTPTHGRARRDLLGGAAGAVGLAALGAGQWSPTIVFVPERVNAARGASTNTIAGG